MKSVAIYEMARRHRNAVASNENNGEIGGGV